MQELPILVLVRYWQQMLAKWIWRESMKLKYYHIVAIIVNIPIVIIAIVTIATVIIPIVIIAIVVKATAAAAVGKMELARTHGTEIPEGWALDKWAFFHTDKDKQVGFFTIRERQRHLVYVSYHHPHDNHHLNHHHHPLSSSC